ncbi:MAG: RodZ domain-containing protein [Candidatus Altimarinota bacterium]
MIRFFTRTEKIIMMLLVILIGVTSVYLYSRFIRDNSELIASEGGIYTEGVVGRPLYLNPVLLLGNQVDNDVSRLVFSGLTKYNSHTGLIEDDIATSEKSKDNLSYTFTLLADAKWHDGQPVTADDVVYTYESVIKSPSFKNASLKQTFAEVSVEKISERVVKFKLASPYSFFLSNVTIGLLPKHLLEFVPVENLEKSEFNQSPVGTGPYRFGSWTVSNDTHEVTLKRNEEYYGALPKVQTVIFRAFPDASSLLVAENTLTGFRLSTEQIPEKLFADSSRFEAFDYRLPQYSALFLNTRSDMLSNKKVRFALLLATDKDRIQEIVQNSEVVDTPILESKADLDIEFSLERAMGAFFDTEWNLPEKVKAKAEQADGSGGPVNMALIGDAAELRFEVQAIQDSWLTIRLDGVLQPSFLMKKDETKTYTVQKSLTFQTIGNAAGIKTTVNGVGLKAFGGDGVVVRNLVLDRTTLENYVVEDAVPTPVAEPEPDPVPTPDVQVPPEDVEVPDEVEEAQDEEPVVKPMDELDRVRVNSEGKRLVLRLVTAQEPPVFLQVAEEIQKQWLEAGAKVVIETYPLVDLQEKISKRDYDILLFGQNLGYNLDAFPFWHSSQAESGLNLSDYRSLEVDNLLVSIRNTFDERTKQELLDKLKKIIAEDTPAVFLYNPTHYYLIDRSVKNVQLGRLSNHSDRFTDLSNWYLKEDYRLKEDFSFSGLIRWLFTF